MHRLEHLGWSSFFEAQIESETDRTLTPARVVEEQRTEYALVGERGRWAAALSGRLRHATGNAASRPCVGDWVLARVPNESEDGIALIERVLARRTRFARQAPGERTDEQVIAANADTVFLVMSLNTNLNLRRLERYLALLWESGAEPVVVLSKADLCADPDAAVAEIESVAPGVAVRRTSALAPDGLAPLEPWLVPGRTVALVGSSGVGKSTIVNRLAGEDVMRVAGIRADDRGRHTTTSRHLVILPGGALLLDTPGMRTVLMWEGEEGLERAFEDIEALARECRFRDCAHESEPGCAVQAALATGALDADRYRGFLKLRREIRHQVAKTDVAVRREVQRQWRQIHRELRRRPDKRGRA